MKMAIVSGSENLKKGEEEERGGMLAIRKHPRRMNEMAMTMNRVEVYRRLSTGVRISMQRTKQLAVRTPSFRFACIWWNGKHKRVRRIGQVGNVSINAQ